MSATAQQSQRTVNISLDDPFSSLFQPSFDPGPVGTRKSAAFANAQIDSSQHKAQTFLPPTVQPTFSDPLLRQPSTLETQFVPRDEYRKAKRSARDGWIGVGILAGFIAIGTYYFIDRVGSDGVRIDGLSTQVTDLNKQLAGERGVVLARNKEIKLLNDQLSDEHKKNGNVRKR